MSLSDWVIAIPSYKRYDMLVEKTLTTLKNYKIPPLVITVFVADKEEEAIRRSRYRKGRLEI
jgi:hypothetical protein